MKEPLFRRVMIEKENRNHGSKNISSGCDGYRDWASWLEQPEHTGWGELPDFT